MKARMLMRRKIIAEKKKEREKEEEKEGAPGEAKEANAVNFEDQSEKISELEQRLLEAQKEVVVQRRKAHNAESLVFTVEEKELENKVLKAEIKKLKHA